MAIFLIHDAQQKGNSLYVLQSDVLSGFNHQLLMNQLHPTNYGILNVNVSIYRIILYSLLHFLNLAISTNPLSLLPFLQLHYRHRLRLLSNLVQSMIKLLSSHCRLLKSFQPTLRCLMGILRLSQMLSDALMLSNG